MAHRQSSDRDTNPNQELEVRIDKWLWAARFFKTRAHAREIVNAGKVHYDGQRVKPSKNVKIGATLRIPAGYDEKVVVVVALLDRRQNATIAASMYEETSESIDARERNAQARKLSVFHSPRPVAKPDKKQRRQLIDFKHR